MIVCKDEETIEKKRDRAHRAGANLYKLIFYTITSIYGYIILKDSPILPWYLGGSGNLDNIFTGMPYQEKIPYHLEYCLIQLGYFIEDFTHHLFFKERTSDFWEMILHHCLTLTLLSGMILQNIVRVGIVISWLHTFSDVTTASTRFFSQTPQKNATIVSFTLCIIFWILCRNYCIPLVTYGSIMGNVYPPELAEWQNATDILNFFLLCLCLMHVYWLTLFLNMYIGGIVSGITDDKQRGVLKKK